MIQNLIQSPPLYKLLKYVVKDNPTYNFPSSTIINELTRLYLNQNDFNNIVSIIYEKLYTNNSEVVSQTFIHCLQRVFPMDESIIDSIPEEKYYAYVEELIDLLQSVKITRVDKRSADGVMISAMR